MYTLLYSSEPLSQLIRLFQNTHKEGAIRENESKQELNNMHVLVSIITQDQYFMAHIQTCYARDV